MSIPKTDDPGGPSSSGKRADAATSRAAPSRGLSSLTSGWTAGTGVRVLEQVRAAAGAALGIAVTAGVCRFLLGHWSGVPWLLAPLGASAVLVFVMPSSPMGQPWAVIGGHAVSALVGLACVTWIPQLPLAAGLAVGLSIGCMFALRCLHPPGGGMALAAVLSGSLHPEWMLLAVTLNTVLLVSVACVYNPASGHRYPHRSQMPGTNAVKEGGAPGTGVPVGPRFSPADLDEALAHYREVLDVSRDDLENLLHEAEAAAYRRTLGSLKVRAAMSRDPVMASPDLPISQAWALMREREIKALPVVDSSHALIGILTRSDCLRAAPPIGSGGVGAPEAADAGPTSVGRWMSLRVTVARDDQSLIELLPLFSQAGHHHLPIVDSSGLLVGILTESDVVRALATAVRPV